VEADPELVFYRRLRRSLEDPDPDMLTITYLFCPLPQLTTRFCERFGIGPSETYTPHVSLGYFANREAAQLSVPFLEDLNSRFEERMHALTLPLSRVSVYGFTDMATFFRAAVVGREA
jgi:hypothetical protein